MLKSLTARRFSSLSIGLIVLMLLSSFGLAISGPLAARADDGDVELSGYVLQQVKDATVTTSAFAAPDLTISLVLKPRELDALQDLAYAVATPNSPQYHQFLTPAQFADRFSPTQADYDSVIAYLQDKGFQVTNTYANRLTVDAKAGSNVVAQTFNTEFVSFNQNGRDYFGVKSEPKLSAALAAKVSYVAGLSNFSRLKTSTATSESNKTRTESAQVGFEGYSPAQLRKAYNAAPLTSAGVDGNGVTIGILLPTAFFDQADLNAFSDKYGLPRSNVRLVGKLQDPTSKDFEIGGYVEALLDLETSHGAAPGANIVLYAQPTFSDVDVIKVFQDFVNENKADVANGSFGGPESLQGGEFILASTTLLLQGAVQGTSIFFSSGDAGIFNEAPFEEVGGNPKVESASFPATLPIVTAVGGTTLKVTADSDIANETGWGYTEGTFPPGRPSSGGGQSVIFKKPFFQNSFTTNAYRTIPDVSANADPATGYAVTYNRKYVGGPDAFRTIPIGGTSGSSPLWAGFSSLLVQFYAERFGLLTPYFYDLNYSIFRDVTEGFNGKKAGIGYDEVTGLGTVDVLKLGLFIPGTPHLIPLPPSSVAFERVNPNVTVQPGGRIEVTLGIHNNTTSEYTLPSAIVPLPAGASLAGVFFTSPDAYVTAASPTEARLSFGKAIKPGATVAAFLELVLSPDAAIGTVIRHRSQVSFNSKSGVTNLTTNQFDLLVDTRSTTDLTQDGLFAGRLAVDGATGDLVLSDSRLGLNEPITLWYNTSSGTTFTIPSGYVTSSGGTDATGSFTVRILNGKWPTGNYTLVAHGNLTGTEVIVAFSSQGGKPLAPAVGN